MTERFVVIGAGTMGAGIAYVAANAGYQVELVEVDPARASAALEQLHLSPHNVVGIGDAENDHAFMNLCEASAAVANALPMLKERADYLTTGDHGAGVVELIDMISANDLADLEPKLDRYQILLGTLAAIGLWLALRHMPESRSDEAEGRFDWLGSLVAALAIGGLSFGLVRGQEQRWQDTAAWLAIAVGAAASSAAPQRAGSVPASTRRRRGAAICSVSRASW